MFHDADDPQPPQVHPSTYFRIAQLQSSALFPSLRHLQYNLKHASNSDSHIFFFLSPFLDSLEFINIKGFEDTIVGPFLVTLSSQQPQILSRIVLRSGQMSVGILKKSIVLFKQLRSLELLDAVFMSDSDFVLWEALGTLPFLENLTLKSIDPAPHPAHAPENLNSQSGGLKYFDALKSLCITGSIFFIEHLLGFIDSPYLKTIKVYPVINNASVRNEPEPDNLFIPSMTIAVSKWSHSLNYLVIDSSSESSGTPGTQRYAISKCLMLLTDFHEMQAFRLKGLKMENMDEDVRRLVTSWPKLRFLRFPHSRSFISLSTLRIIAENCPELRQLYIRLDASTVIEPSNTPSKSLHHQLEILNVGKVHLSSSRNATSSLECQIQMARHLDLIFPCLKSIEVQPDSWSGIRDLVMHCQKVRRGQY